MNLIAVWGSSGAGKTTVSLALAAALAKKENVLLVSTANREPALPVYLPKSELGQKESLGGLFEADNIIVDSLKDRLHPHPKSRHLCFAGFAAGELPGMTNAYKPISLDAAKTFLHLLDQTEFQHIIVDCDANPAYDAITLIALQEARSIIRIITPDAKGYEFQKAHFAWMNGQSQFRLDQHIKIANLVYDYSPENEARALVGGFDFVLPYASQISKHMSAGQLLCGFNERKSIDFERQITKLTLRIQEDTYHGE